MGNNIIKVVIWLCKNFNRDEVKSIKNKLSEILKDPDSDFKPKDTFKEDHPNYRAFEVDPNPPLKKNQKKRKFFFTKTS